MDQPILGRTADSQGITCNKKGVNSDPDFSRTPGQFSIVAARDLEINAAGDADLFLRRSLLAGEIREHPASDLPLGVLPEQTFGCTEVQSETGDILLLLTDGLTEVFDRNGRELGIGPLKEALSKSSTQGLPELSASLRQVSLSFGRQSDDQTMLIIRHL